MLGLAAAAEVVAAGAWIGADHHQFGRCPQALMPGACRQHHHVAGGDVEVAAARAAETHLGAAARDAERLVMLTLHHGRTSVCSIKARLALAEKGVPFDSKLRPRPMSGGS